MGVHATNSQERLSIGEMLFVFGVIIALATQLLGSAIGLVLGFAWTGLLLAIVSPILLLVFVNNTYTGKRSAWMLLLLLVVIEVAIAGAALATHLRSPMAPGLAIALGLPVAALAACKLTAYLILGCLLLGFAPIGDLLASKRGDTIAVSSAPKLSPSGVTVPLAAPEMQALDQLGSLLRSAGCVLAVVGVLRLLGLLWGDGVSILLAVGEGVVLLLLGLFMQTPACAVKRVQRDGPDVTFLTHALQSLHSLFLVKLVLGLVLVLVLVGGLILRLR